MSKWAVKIETWPYSTGKGSAVDQEACGDRSSTYTIEAGCIRAALEKSELIVHGIRTNPRVWLAPIVSITVVR